MLAAIVAFLVGEADAATSAGDRARVKVQPSATVRRVRLAGLLTTLLLLSACGSSVAEQDSGQPPPRDQDAGYDAGHTDAGASDAGTDAGPLGCEADAGPSVERDGGSLVCAACSSTTGCGAQGACLSVQPSTCLGTCALFGDACADTGPAPERFVVTVQVDSFSCPNRNPGGCDFVHDVDPATGDVTLSLRLLGADAGVTRALGVTSTGVATALQAASASALWCLGERDLFADRCVERSSVIRVEASAGDAGVVVTWPLRAGHLPPEALHAVVLDVLRVGDGVFRDAGVAWTRTPP